jgi:ABC-type dipeptide/oligopeptide/nickel transport system permease subunit
VSSAGELVQVGDVAVAEPEPTGAIAGRTPWQLAWARLRRDRVAMGAAVLLVLLVLLAVFAPVFAHLTGHPPNQQYRTGKGAGLSLDNFPVGPNGSFWLGADDLGRDVLVRTLYGARISLLVGVAATAIALVVGSLVGVVAGYFGGRIDAVLSRVIDIFLSFPFLVTALTLVTLNKDKLGQPRISPVWVIILVVALFGWTYFARLVRGQVLALREREFIEAARSLGASSWRIMRVDVLPNLVAPVTVYATLQIPVNIVLEATLSFLGVGVQAPTASWGSMLADAQSSDTYTIAPWFLLAPSVALLLTVLAFNLLGDGLRDALDPRAARVLKGA